MIIPDSTNRFISRLTVRSFTDHIRAISLWPTQNSSLRQLYRAVTKAINRMTEVWNVGDPFNAPTDSAVSTSYFNTPDSWPVSRSGFILRTSPCFFRYICLLDQHLCTDSI